MRFFLSGLHSDPNPSPGVGEALSLREAFPLAEIIGVDYSAGSSGIHHPVFDSVLIQPRWDELNLKEYAARISSWLADQESCWLSGLDVEIAWLSRSLPGECAILNPLRAVAGSCTKPAFRSVATLGMNVAAWQWADSEASELERLGESNEWRVWAKGAFCDAIPASSIEDVHRHVARLNSDWPGTRCFVQAHVEGEERAWVFAALQGVLLDAVEIEKCSFTEGRKTWAATVHALSIERWHCLANYVRSTGWTGGGDIEFIRNRSGDFVIDINPRFPANVHGVTLCGRNLPARLAAAFFGLEFTEAETGHIARQFTRVVVEVPARAGHPIPATTHAQPGVHPSHEPLLAARLSALGASD